MTTKYKALLVTPRHMERQIQSFSNDYARLTNWARIILKAEAERVENPRVEIYEAKEDLVETIYPEETTGS